MTASRAEDRDYSRLRAEWLRLKNQVFDANAELPTLAAVLDDVRRLCAVESEGITGCITGRAIYEGRLDFAAALKVAAGEA